MDDDSISVDGNVVVVYDVSGSVDGVGVYVAIDDVSGWVDMDVVVVVNASVSVCGIVVYVAVDAVLGSVDGGNVVILSAVTVNNVADTGIVEESLVVEVIVDVSVVVVV